VVQWFKWESCGF